MPRLKTLAKTLRSLTLLLAAITPNIIAQGPIRQLLRLGTTSAQSRQTAGAKPAGLGNNPFLLIDYPGGIANQYAAGINDKGKIVGLTGLPDGSFQGYLLQGSAFKLISYPGAPSTGAFAINKSGTIVGTYCDDIDCNGGHGFELKGKAFTALDYPGGMNTEATGINAAGDIVGSYQTPDDILHGFLLHRGVYTSFDMPGALGTNASSINKQGTIVGDFFTNDGSGGHGFILQNGVFTQVDYQGAYGTSLSGINDSGEIIGSYAESQGGENHGFLLSGGTYSAFDVPFPGSISTVGFALNNNRQIVGSYGSFPPDYFFGFLTTY